MIKVQRTKAAVIAEINSHLNKWNDGYTALAEAAGINYYAARRAILNGLKNDSKLMLNLCTFFKVEPYIIEKVQTTSLESLTQTLRETWDGSEPHAELLHNLIKSTKPFKVQERRN